MNALPGSDAIRASVGSDFERDGFHFPLVAMTREEALAYRAKLEAHEDTFHEHNLLSRGQEIAVEVDEHDAVDVTLRAGEFSLHHVLLAHGSHPNTSADRRIGFAIRYIPTSVRQTKLRDAAVLVRGVDRFGHFDLLDGPAADLDQAALAAHADSAARLQAAVYSGTDKQDFRD